MIDMATTMYKLIPLMLVYSSISFAGAILSYSYKLHQQTIKTDGENITAILDISEHFSRTTTERVILKVPVKTCKDRSGIYYIFNTEKLYVSDGASGLDEVINKLCL
jgi:hypothetical protein